eukprot:Tamp_25066.p2 GENE.Tamp_25066~~Tamp_25066.p2  ORF type:complete len:205 (+),score=37.76 Tamp_25066:83-697(+)
MAAAHPSGPALRRLRALVLCACLDAVRRGVACGAAAGAAPAAACMHAAPPLRGGGGGGRGGGVVGEGGVLAQRLAGDALRAEAEESAQRRALRKKRKERKERRRRRALAQGDGTATPSSSAAKVERRLLDGSLTGFHENTWVEPYDDPPAGCHEPPDLFSGTTAATGAAGQRCGGSGGLAVSCRGALVRMRCRAYPPRRTASMR